jgi:hypothetical protein
MPTYNVPSSFATIALAVANAGVVDGDTIEITAGYTETLTTTLNVNKALTFIGLGANPGSQLVQTAGLGTDPATMITIADTPIVWRNIEFRHNKSTNTGTERIFNSAGLNKLTLDQCNLYHMEFGVVGIYEDLTITNCLIEIAGVTPLNQNVHISLTGVKGTFYFHNNTFDALVGATQTRFIQLSANATFPFGNGGDCSVIVHNCSWDGTGNLATGVFFARFDFMGTGLINLDCRNNNWTVPTSGLGCYRLNSTNNEVNILNNFRNIRFSGNRHNTTNIGMLSAGGTTTIGVRALGAIQGDWTICSNQITGTISSGSYSIYHFGNPQVNKLFGIQTAIFTNPYPTPNPHQDYINCAGGYLSNNMLQQFNEELLWRAFKTKSPHKFRAEMKL